MDWNDPSSMEMPSCNSSKIQQVPIHTTYAGENTIDCSRKTSVNVNVMEISRDTQVSEPGDHEDIGLLVGSCDLHIVFTTLDPQTPQASRLQHDVFHKYSIPSQITEEHNRSVSHSFGTRTDPDGYCAWFRSLSKDTSFLNEPRPAVGRGHQAMNQSTQGSSLHMPHPMEDYRYNKSSFFLRISAVDSRVTLVCFGASPSVRQSLQHFIVNGPHEVASIAPLLLFEVTLQGLFRDIDESVWNLGDAFGPLEYRILNDAISRCKRRQNEMMPFTSLHNISKHAIYLHEGVTSHLLLIDRILATLDEHGVDAKMIGGSEPKVTGSTTTITNTALARHRVRESLEYRQTMFKSTQLRLSSLRHRIDNMLSLSFNLVTQQDSMSMLRGSTHMARDSNSMKIISGITMLFLPATAVASILGSQVFQDNAPTPLFYVMVWITIPLTVIVFVSVHFWKRWTERKLDGGHDIEV
ncbi:hypothetical protein BJ166DRAFT_352024 [Pestalotiopsis sp. NC0098]|nr:hypothetical protein BJ166DRAFT_352024 [Pestalotiopsis sp. NC0098]